jgi:hypothetical protein
MFVQSHLSMVLSGVSVLRGGKAVDVRLGKGYLCGWQSTGQPFSTRTGGTEPDAHPVEMEKPCPANPCAMRAGRSARFAGVRSSRIPPSTIGGEAFECGQSTRRGHSPLLAQGRRDWAKPSGRTPPASTRGQVS